MEQYLRQYIDYSQKDVYEWLPMADFAANNAVNGSTKVSPFFANKGFHPRMSFGPPRPTPNTTSKNRREQIIAGNNFASKMAEVLEVLRTNLTRAREKQERAANKNRSSAPAYRVGDETANLFAIEAIVDSKRSKNKKIFYYLILWRGEDPEDQTWEPLQNVVNATASIQEFERRFPDKLKPTKSEIQGAKQKANASVKKLSPGTHPKGSETGPYVKGKTRNIIT
ncbi:hypothetical protein K3495_g4643 [Podosphaera aphanis]|nr:hypothetical protein K3495_g4643 [Podosphaera aphanis]